MNRLAIAAVLPTAAVLMAAAAPPTTPAPVDPAKIEITTTKLAPGVAVLFGAGGNIGVSYGVDGTIFVDDQFAPLTPKILAATKGLDSRPVKFVINTHWHFDHSGGNENLGKEGSVIVAHENVRRRMSAEGIIEELNAKFPPSPKAALPSVTFSDGVTLHLNDDTLRVVHVRSAHTDGDSIVKWERANVLHMGDVFNRSGAPFVDRSSGGSVVGMIAAMDAGLKLADDKTQVIPGHGPMSTKADMQAYRDALAAFNTRIAAEIKAGKTQDQILAMKLTWKAASGDVPADRLVRSAYQDLTAKK
ncbi:MAG: MBL fold metallo-hydrolase [Rhodospirillaceae bacterium]